MMGVGATAAGQYTQIFANQVDPADSADRSGDAECTNPLPTPAVPTHPTWSR